MEEDRDQLEGEEPDVEVLDGEKGEEGVDGVGGGEELVGEDESDVLGLSLTRLSTEFSSVQPMNGQREREIRLTLGGSPSMSTSSDSQSKVRVSKQALATSTSS